MSDKTELLPCPWCGGESFVRIDISLLLTQSRYRVGCDKDPSCHGWYGHSRYYATEAEAIAAWNARAERTCHNTHENRWFKCSACGYGFTDLYAEDEGDINEQPRYCPNCGCKVVGE